jgi:hypothetical protein
MAEAAIQRFAAAGNGPHFLPERLRKGNSPDSLKFEVCAEGIPSILAP